MIKELEENTKWIVDNWVGDGEKRAEVLEKFSRRHEIKTGLTENYYNLNKFRVPTPYFRNGVIREDGRKIVWE